MSLYRKKPVEVNAWRISELIALAPHDRPRVVADAVEAGSVRIVGDSMSIKTLEGVMVGLPNDWLICGVANELYPCKASIFAATYQPVEPDL